MKRTVSAFVLLLLIVQAALSGREGEYSDRYPKFTEIVRHGSSIYFAGCWITRYIVVELDGQGGWKSYSVAGNKYAMSEAMVFKMDDGLVFWGVNGFSRKFLYRTKQWEDVPPAVAQKLYEQEQTGGERRAIEEGGPVFPVPSLASFARWRYVPNDWTELSAGIGDAVSRDSALWFSIGFYDSEGSSGIGGLGLYDLRKRKFGVIRDSILVTCSDGLMGNAGDTIIVATNRSLEYGRYGDRGLVLVDIKRGLIANIPLGSLIDGSYFLSMKIIGDVLYLASDRAIMLWDLRKNSWKSYRADSVVVNKDCSLYRRAQLNADFTPGGLPTRIVYDSTFAVASVAKGTLLFCEWPYSDFAEVQTRERITGWISKQRVEQIVSASHLERATGFPVEIVYADEAMSLPIHTFHSSPVSLIRQTDRSAFVAVHGGWVRFSDVDPLFSETRGVMPLLQWRTAAGRRGDLRSAAFETLEREEEEKKSGTPVIDTLITIRSTMDVYDELDKFFNGAFWLPTEHGPHAGVRLDRKEFVARGGKLYFEERAVGQGETVSAETKRFIQLFQDIRFTIGGEGNVLKELTFRYKVLALPGEGREEE